VRMEAGCGARLPAPLAHSPGKSVAEPEISHADHSDTAVRQDA